MKLEPHVERLLKQRYFQPGEDWSDLVQRVVRNVCKDDDTYFAAEMLGLIYARIFIPNSPCLVNAGTKNNGLVACFTVGPTEDTIENHGETLLDIAMVGKFGGGCGFTARKIRHKGAAVNGSAHDTGKGIAYGPNAWAMRVSDYLDMITQGGFRKMALMYAMDSDHRDLEEFIDLKQTGDERRGYNFNQSVMATDDWLSTAIGDPESKEARLFNKIIFNAWNNGEPGLLFRDTINENTPYLSCGCEINTTNPCGEQPLPAYLACVLGSINVAHDTFWVNGTFDYDRLAVVTAMATRFLDNVGSVTNFPNQKFADAYAKHRPIGIGIMGLADAFMNAGLKYGSTESIKMTQDIFYEMLVASYQQSKVLGMERGVPEHCQRLGRRNITTLTVAPTGSIAFIANCSHGIEPIFSREYTRTDERGETYRFVHPMADSDFFVEAADLTWKQHIDIQTAAQIHVDAGVSKTINLPNHATVADVREAFIYAWQNNAKGITVYRDGSRQKEVITIGEKQTTHRKRPAKLPADLYSIKPNGHTLVAAVGMLDEKPYEVFVFRHAPLQGKAHIVKNAPKRYDVVLEDGTVIKEIGQLASSEEQLLARLISLNLRSGVDIRFIVEQIAKAEGYVSSYGASVNRALKNYVNGSLAITCQDCGSKDIALIEGCETCQSCGSSKCS